MGPADRVHFGSAGARVARRADRGEAHEQFTQVRAARMRKTLLLLCGLYWVLARERGVLQYTPAANETERECFFPPPLRCAWASFYMLKGSPTGGNVDKGKNGKVLRLVQLPATMYHT